MRRIATTLFALALSAIAATAADVDVGEVVHWIGNDDGTSDGTLSLPWHCAWDPDGNLFITGPNDRILKGAAANPTNLQTFVGGTQAGHVDATGTGAEVNDPRGFVLNSRDNHNLVFTDAANHVIRVADRLTGAVATAVGQAGVAGYAEGAGSSAQFNTPGGIEFYFAEECYYVTEDAGNRVRRITSSLANRVPMTTHFVAGSTTGASGNTDSATGANALFNGPKHLTIVQSSEDMFIADTANNKVRQVTAIGAVTSPGPLTGITAPHGVSVSHDDQFVFVSSERRIYRYTIASMTTDTILNSQNDDIGWSSDFVTFQATALQLYGMCWSYDHSTMYVVGENAVSYIAFDIPPTGAPTSTEAPPTTNAETTAAPTGTQTPVPAQCNCPNALNVDYTSLQIPEATEEAVAEMRLNETTWEVEMVVSNVNRILQGHVIASPLDPRMTAELAFTPNVLAFTEDGLWNPPQCSLGDIDVPAPGLKIRTEYDEATCTMSYILTYALLDRTRQNEYCFSEDDGEDIIINCTLTLTSTRAYDLTEKSSFLSHETKFTSTLTLPKRVNKEVDRLLHATLTKCSVNEGPIWQLDCRTPGVWTFDGPVVVNQEQLQWINTPTCSWEVEGTATYIYCDINSTAPITDWTQLSANLTVTVAGSGGDTMTFDITYIVPRKLEVTVSETLKDFIKDITMGQGLYYYGELDFATLNIDVVDTRRLEITAIDLFNTQGQLYPLRTTPLFRTIERTTPTLFQFEFWPSTLDNDGTFYRYGPHGINVSFTFNAAGGNTRRQQNTQGWAMINGINLQKRGEGENSEPSTGSGASSVPLMAAGAAAASVIVVGAAAALVVYRRRTAKRLAEASVVPAGAQMEMDAVAQGKTANLN